MEASADRRYRRLLTAALAAIALAYLVQLPTPLRLHNDTVVLVSLGESLARGTGFLYHGSGSHYSPGYPAIVALLIKTGTFRVWTAVAPNFAFLALGLWAAAKIVPHGGVIVLMTLLSFVTIKHVTIPLTDVVFFGVAMLCLLMLERGRLWEAGALVLAATAIRFNGVALAPPLFWMLYKRRPILVVPAAIAVAVAALRITSLITPVNKVVAGHTVLDSARQILVFRFREFGEIAVNLPSIALPDLGQAILPWVGAAVLGLIVAGMWIERRRFGPVEIFFLGWSAILFIWPYIDPRFWLPVLPLIFGYASVPVTRWLPKEAIAVYVMAFAMLGVAVLVVSTHITYAGASFPDAYGNAQFRPTYCAYYGTCSYNPNDVDADGLRLLRTYR
jgi:hypothetical protein